MFAKPKARAGASVRRPAASMSWGLVPGARFGPGVKPEGTQASKLSGKKGTQQGSKSVSFEDHAQPEVKPRGRFPQYLDPIPLRPPNSDQSGLAKANQNQNNRNLNLNVNAGPMGEFISKAKAKDNKSPQRRGSYTNPFTNPNQSHKNATFDGAPVALQHHDRHAANKVADQNEDAEGVHINDLHDAAHELIFALMLRQKYLAGSLQSGFFPTTHGFLEKTFKSSKLAKEFEIPHMMWMHPNEFRQLEQFQFADVNDPFSFDLPEPKGLFMKMVDGVVHVFKDQGFADPLDLGYVDRDEFIHDHNHLCQLISNGTCKSFTWRRLKVLQTKFEMYALQNDLKEINETKTVKYRDFYNVRKVDTHIHAAGSMNQKHFLTFIRQTINADGDTIIVDDKANGKLSLNDILKREGISAEEITVDMLDVHADRNTFHRFDRFNNKYNPLGNAQLRDAFLKTDNYIGGRYFGELIKEVMVGLEESRYQYAELRISIYGRSSQEWTRLCKWGLAQSMFSTQVRWLIQVPRIFDVFVKMGVVQSFEDVMHNVFMPLFEATNDPTSHPEIHKFLQYVRGFDSVDDESKAEGDLLEHSSPLPQDYNASKPENPCYAYYLYYMYANIRALNHFRRSRGMNTFTLRPHCGESGAVHHLATAFLTSDNISHGLQLKNAPVLQYLYYLSQMGIAMSPLSNNQLFLEYNKNPLPLYLARGLLISLSTDDPLQFHYTKEPLMEEYSIAAQVWKLSTADLCELARNSVYMSSFAHALKQAWIGTEYLSKEGAAGNDVGKTNVPNLRRDFRHNTLTEELQTLTEAYLERNK